MWDVIDNRDVIGKKEMGKKKKKKKKKKKESQRI